jgi:hypothetical protein
MDASMLERYGIFKKLGFFGVEQQTRRGAVTFLRTAETILQSPQNLLAMTPQSRFVDVRTRPLQFAGGLGHLARRVQNAVFVPFAVEYVFWEERLPELLVRFGEPLEVGRREQGDLSAKEWTALFEQKLAETQDALAAEAQARDTTKFDRMLTGGAGQGGIYDLWRRVRALLRGESFTKEHGVK